MFRWVHVLAEKALSGATRIECRSRRHRNKASFPDCLAAASRGLAAPGRAKVCLAAASQQKPRSKLSRGGLRGPVERGGRCDVTSIATWIIRIGLVHVIVYEALSGATIIDSWTRWLAAALAAASRGPSRRPSRAPGYLPRLSRRDIYIGLRGLSRGHSASREARAPPVEVQVEPPACLVFRGGFAAARGCHSFFRGRSRQQRGG